MTRICFVCLGNICRSPTAEGVFNELLAARGLTERFVVDSAGTGSWHEGNPPHSRSTETARRHGVALEGRARTFRAADFDRFDLVIAMDRSNAQDLRRLARDDTDREKVRLFREFESPPATHEDVPDPYGGGGDGFERVFQICSRSAEGLLETLLKS